VFITIVFLFQFMVHAGKLGQVTNFRPTIAGGTANLSTASISTSFSFDTVY